jgi:hypothetical protein
MKLTRFPFAVGLTLMLAVCSGRLLEGAPKPPDKKPAARPAKAPDEKPPAKSGEADVLYFKQFAGAKAVMEKLPKSMVTERLEAHLTLIPTSYVSAVVGVALSPDKKQLFLVAADGSRHLYDDGRAKDHEQLLNTADIEDMFADNYPLTNPTDRLPKDFDPGRARPEEFFKMLYGNSAEAVRKNLESVSFAGKKVQFNRLHGASAALEKVSQELEPVLKAKPELKVWTSNLDGTFNWRKIEGTDRLSTHSYGIAIDLNASKAKYWRWEKPATLASFSRKDFPAEIIEVFERNGFVWGGKWYHYDTMHFEFRPEILAAARLAGNVPPPVAVPGNEKPAAVEASSKRRALLIETTGKDDGTGNLREGLAKCGFSVEVLKKADLAGVLESVERLATASGGTEVLLFHFSGEAMYRDNKTFLVPANAAIKSPDDLFAEAAPLDRVIESLKKAGAGTKIVLLDTPPATAANGQEGASQEFMVPGFFFGFAGSASAVGARAWQPGVFTRSLAAQIATPKLSLGDMFTMVTQDVTRTSGGAQKPQSFSSLSEIFRFGDGAKTEAAEGK